MAEVKYNEGVELTPQLTIKVLRLLGIRGMHYDPNTNHFKLTYHHFDDKLEWEVREVDVYLHMQEPVFNKTFRCELLELSWQQKQALLIARDVYFSTKDEATYDSNSFCAIVITRLIEQIIKENYYDKDQGVWVIAVRRNIYWYLNMNDLDKSLLYRRDYFYHKTPANRFEKYKRLNDWYALELANPFVKGMAQALKEGIMMGGLDHTTFGNRLNRHLNYLEV